MKTSLQFTALIFSSFVLASCASIVSKSKWPMYIGSNPGGAVVSVVNKKGFEVYQGRTPASITLKSGAGFFAKESYRIKISLPGYEEKLVSIECKLNGWYAGNILIGGLIGLLIIDPATGAMYKLDTDAIHETLSPISVNASPGLNLLSVDQVSEEMKGQLIKLN